MVGKCVAQRVSFFKCDRFWKSGEGPYVAETAGDEGCGFSGNRRIAVEDAFSHNDSK